ncbi:MAG: RNA polymerase sigma factor SigJ [Alphaproteobacteria bacterium]|nr:RNA polymerase sigma factor SigJ [Alphaproteobacteria bacterium]
MIDRDATQAFEAARPTLVGLAYRITGSRADAEDAVQDTFLKWAKADRDAIDNAAAWLTTVCTRRCLDMLRAAHRARVDYVGEWLPEPIETSLAPEAGASTEIASSLTTAFMLMLERLTPKERAAYLLHEIFECPYAEIAETLDMQESACRKLVSRAKTHIDRAKVRHTTTPGQQDRLLAAFQDAVTSGATSALAALLADDIRLRADGGGKVPAILKTLTGKAEVMTFVSQSLREYWADFRWLPADINGQRGIVLQHGDVRTAVVTFAYDEAGKATDIYIMRNPDKLSHLDAAPIH